jgi:hypothetical protein
VKMTFNALSFIEEALFSSFDNSAIALLGLIHLDSTICQMSTDLRYALIRIFKTYNWICQRREES